MNEAPNTVTTTTVILVFIVIIVIAGATAWMSSPCNFDQSSWKIFIFTLSSLSIVMMFMFYYAVVELQLFQQMLTYAQELQQLSLSVRHIVDDSFQKYYPIVPQFISSLLPLTDLRECKRDKHSPKATLAKNALSYEIFSVWQLTLADMTYTRASDNGYITLYLQWASSKYLRSEWKRQKGNFSCKTCEFGDSLFKYARRVKRHTIKAYEKMADKVIRVCKF